MSTNKSEFCPTAFIRPGKDNGYYTLRVTELIPTDHGHRIGSYYVKNLPRNRDAAQAAAKAYAEANLMQFSMSELDDLTDFDRRTLKEIGLELERDAWPAAEREAAKAALHLISRGRIPLGPMAGQRIEAAPREWITYQYRREGRDEVQEALHKYIGQYHPDLVFPIPDKTKLVGTPKQGVTLPVVCVKRADVLATGYRGEPVGFSITTMVVTDGEYKDACVVVRSASWSHTVGADFVIKGTVKEHGDYKGQAQTILQRVAEVTP